MKKILILLLLFNPNLLLANELEKILNDANKYTVKISNSTDTPFIEDNYSPSSGSGFLIDKANGLIVTNAHVASYSPSLNRVNFKYSDPIKSKQVYIDPEIDLAFLKIDPKDIPKTAIEAKLQCKNDYKQGSGVVAFGHPAGKDFTITRGIISAIRYETDFFEAIQTDAAINRGNSGGPLINISTGEIIGISSFGVEDNQGLNFALPSYSVCKIIELFKNKKDPSPLDLKVIFSNNKEQGKFLKISEIIKTENNPLRVGDEIIEIDGKKVENPTQLSNETRGKANITLKLIRENKTIELKLSPKPKGSVTERVGLIFSNVIIGDKGTSTSLDINQRMNNPQGNLVVQNLRSGPASGKLRKFDVIQYIDGKEFKTIQSLHDYLKDKKEIEIFFRRPSLNEERKINFTDYFDKIEVKDIKILKFE
ncbi:DegQ Trypsin-like serine proteases, typically periplasmic, contain C-terminal PDZ domain [Candidatus Pelagibacterales bacterium]|jgi:serine protease Do